jgi:hypothetical protein
MDEGKNNEGGKARSYLHRQRKPGEDEMREKKQ